MGETDLDLIEAMQEIELLRDELQVYDKFYSRVLEALVDARSDRAAIRSAAPEPSAEETICPVIGDDRPRSQHREERE